MSAAEVACRVTEKAGSDIPPVTRMLGDWVAGLSYDAIPEVSIRHAKRCFLDGLGCGLYGNSQEWGIIASAGGVAGDAVGLTSGLLYSFTTERGKQMANIKGRGMSL